MGRIRKGWYSYRTVGKANKFGVRKNLGLDDEEPIGKLMHDFRCRNSVDMFYPLLAKEVKYLKETEGGREIVCKTFEDLAEKRIMEDRKITAKMQLRNNNITGG